MTLVLALFVILAAAGGGLAVFTIRTVRQVEAAFRIAFIRRASVSCKSFYVASSPDGAPRDKRQVCKTARRAVSSRLH